MKRKFILSLCILLVSSSYVLSQEKGDKFKRCVLLEEFTTENCAICPHITKYVHQLMDEPEYRKKVVVVTHHSGNYEDFLTTQADRELKWIYNERTYTPAFMFDRFSFFNTQNTSELISTPVGLVNNLPAFKDYVDTRMNVVSHVALDISANFDGDETLNVMIKAERDAEFNIKNPRITVYLIENNIKAQRQKGVKDVYIHQYSLRACNNTWGDEIIWNNNQFTYECSLQVDSNFKKEDLEIVAFVSNYNPEDPNDCVVENTRMIPFENALDIHSVSKESELNRTEYYSLDGIYTKPVNGGVYIQKDIFTDGRTQIRKIVK